MRMTASLLNNSRLLTDISTEPCEPAQVRETQGQTPWSSLIPVVPTSQSQPRLFENQATQHPAPPQGQSSTVKPSTPMQLLGGVWIHSEQLEKPLCLLWPAWVDVPHHGKSSPGLRRS